VPNSVLPRGAGQRLEARAYLAELFGTFLVVLFGAGAVCAAYLPRDPVPGPAHAGAAAAALAEGGALAAVLTATLLLSPGCLNPAVTFVLWMVRQLSTAQAFGLAAAQALGALLAGLVVRGLFRDDVLAAARLFALVVTLAVFSTVVDPRGPKLGGLMVGLAQAAAVAFGFHLTGGCANPVRWLGPVLWEHTLPGPGPLPPLADHLPYWLGTAFGALAGGVLYTLVFLPPRK
jgi:glycerol uptake facilitator-like aquaporin